MTDNDLTYISATQAQRRFRDRSLSPVELLDALIARYDSIAESVNPFGDCYFDEARERARSAEDAFVDGIEPGPLAGLPLVVKDTSAIEGRRTAKGSMIYKDHVDTETDPDIERLLNAGANLFARSTTPEFGWLYTTQSRIWGVTHNPWRHGISPGGSSGGSASALAAGATTLSTGGDSTGSIRQPASQCGVVGYQAPFGRIPMPGSSSFSYYLHHGPLTRTVADAALMTNIMSGPDPRDHNSLQERVVIPDDLSGIAGMKIAVSIDLGYYDVVDDVQRETRLALDALRDAGAQVDEIVVDWADEAIRLGHGGQEFLFVNALDRIIEEHGDIVSDYVPQLAETTHSFTLDDYNRSNALAGEVWKEHLGPMFTQYDAFITPTVACPEFPATGWQRDTVMVNGKPVTDTQLAMTVLWNMFGYCPVLSVPSGLSDGGLPTGIQIIGRPCDDETVFRVGAALEARRPWLDTPERRPSLA
ncbi:MAG: amidase [Rhodospirillaceae bacterium]|jgi:Asp-tRNA(Asn)/Glu-tRNA(Gln) amidotransferase A subunit family amidase|nr:amidase [Rhodospirillaceae bacterium]MBT6511556.1 amidase [Rhodospirillaceae bacterium]MBT7647702.1 amidase [Rhodospirillaceae bacterium]